MAHVQDWIDRGVLRERPDGTRNPLQTVPLLDTISAHRFDAVFGGGRRDEEKARAKERIFSLRDEFGQWDPRRQRPELWDLYNGRHAPGEHVRVFPLSNWTEGDVWRYIDREGIELPSIYYAHDRAVFLRNSMWLTAGEWGGPRADETVEVRRVRYRTVGDMSCTGRGGLRRHDRGRGHRRGRGQPAHRARRDPRRRPHVRGGHGGSQEGGVLLMAHELLRLATAGSVDDGKSTLVGRLLYDTKSILADTMDAIEQVSRDRGLAAPDLALLTDGLRAEREQGITIDVAYRYFATPNRSFILADTPGHVQYTRNMVTGASTAELALILVDARNGVVEQTRRHAAISALLGVRHIAVVVNKMDLVGFDRDVFEAIRAEFDAYARAHGVDDVVAIPISALDGDNVVTRSPRTAWYRGPTLLEHLEARAGRQRPGPPAVPVPGAVRDPPAGRRAPRLPRATPGGSRRAPCSVGDEVVVAPSGARTDRGRDRHLRRAAGVGAGRPVGHACGWPTTSTSPAATCSPPREAAPGGGPRRRARR